MRLGQKLKAGLRVGVKVAKVGLGVAGGVLGAKLYEQAMDNRYNENRTKD